MLCVPLAPYTKLQLSHWILNHLFAAHIVRCLHDTLTQFFLYIARAVFLLSFKVTKLSSRRVCDIFIASVSI